ncbi:MAG: class I SAM-dependent methyltransferase family protein [Gimesia sp.]
MTVVNVGKSISEVSQPKPIWVSDERNQPLERVSLTQSIACRLTNPYKNYLLPERWLKGLLSSSQSVLLAETFRRPGGWRTMEIMYHNEKPVDKLDQQAIRANSIARASRNRLQIVTQILMDLISQYSEQGKVTIMGVGAGPGRHVQTAISRLNLTADHTTAYLIDLDDDAFDYGCRFARQLGISDVVNFLQGDAREIQKVLPDVNPHVVKLIGLVEYLDDQQLSELLRALHQVMIPGGTLVTHGLVDPYNGSPFLKRIFGLEHVKRTGKEMQQILESTGFRTVDLVEEPMKVFPILTVVKDS